MTTHPRTGLLRRTGRAATIGAAVLASAVVGAPVQADAAPALRAPFFTITSPPADWTSPNDVRWFNEATDVTYNAVAIFPDRLTGIAWTATGAQPGRGTSQTSPLTITTRAQGVTRYTGTATANGDETATAEHVVGIDTSGPVIALGEGLVQGMTVLRDAAVPFAFTCSDQFTDVETCRTVEANNGTLDTSTVGSRRIELEAMDKVGNTTALAFTYTVAEAPLTVVRDTGIAGSARPGGTLTATPPQLSGTPDSISYRWLRDGQPITGATGTTYRPGAADVGRALSAQATARTANRADTVSTSSTLRVARATPRVALAGTSPRRGVVVLTATTTAPGLRPTGRYVVTRGGRTVARVNLVPGRATRITLARQPRGAQAYQVAYSGSPTVSPGSARRTVRVR